MYVKVSASLNSIAFVSNCKTFTNPFFQKSDWRCLDLACTTEGCLARHRLIWENPNVAAETCCRECHSLNSLWFVWKSARPNFMVYVQSCSLWSALKWWLLPFVLLRCWLCSTVRHCQWCYSLQNILLSELNKFACVRPSSIQSVAIALIHLVTLSWNGSK